MDKPGSIPPYSVRESKKARRVTLKVFPDRGLEVVIPRGFDPHRIPKIIEEKREWIQRVFRSLGGDGECPEESSHPGFLPEYIHLNAAGKSYKVQYSNGVNEKLGLIESEGCELTFIGNTTDYEACRHLLQTWLGRQARGHLVALVEEMSDRSGLSFNKIQIRGQRSRWGSCSVKGTISLNYKLMFLPCDLVRYVMIHELCHTVHLNHSRQFWSLVTKLEPACKTLRAEMKTASRYVPVWTG